MKESDSMWAMVMFDLPTMTKQQRKVASQYRVGLKNMGFKMLQLSVYGKYLINAEGFKWLSTAIKTSVPDEGMIRMLWLTDEQWSKMLVFEGKKRVNSEPKPQQLTIF
jgi:CRISPR-associated protein Cas2